MTLLLRVFFLVILFFAPLAQAQSLGNCFAGTEESSFANPFFMEIAPRIVDEDRDFVWASLQKVYAEDFRKRGSRLVFFESERKDFGADTFRESTEPAAWILLYQGSRYHRQMTPAVLALMMCHEIGHHLGGAPFTTRASWASVEGQADYFSTLDCWKRLHPQLKEKTWMQTQESSRRECEIAMPLIDPEVCASGVEAAAQLSQIMGGLRGELARDWSFGVRDQTRTTKLNENHPTTSCRWETFLRGLSFESRPACWFPF